MTLQQSAYVDMLRALQITIEANTAAWSAFEPFADGVPLLAGNLLLIDDAITTQGTNTTGVTAEKNAKRADMVPPLLKIAAALRIIGKLNNDDNLQRKGMVNKSDLDKSKDDSFFGMANRLIATALAISHLVRDPYGITGVFLSDLNGQLNAFRDSIGSPRSAETTTQRATKQLAAAIADTDDLLTTRLDPAAFLLNDTQPVFYTEYSLSREIHEPSYNTRSLEVKVTDRDGNPLELVDAMINPGAIDKRTSANGAFYVSSMGAGSYTGVFSRPGFADKHVDFAITPGLTTDISVVLDGN